VICVRRRTPNFLPMTHSQETILMIKGLISSLPAAQQEACNELAEQMRRQIAAAGEPIGTLVVALIGAETQEKAGG
jgi:hypothetical protein